MTAAKTLLLVILLAGCGSIYRSADVVPGIYGSTNVRVLPMTAETVAFANRAPYRPHALPAVFSATAGTGGGLRGVGALPSPPAISADRPPRPVLNPPPDSAGGPYRIGVGDVVLLSTPATGGTIEQLSGLLAAQSSRQGYTVQDDGSINIPNVGRVMLAGMTVDEAEARLFQQLVDNRIDPAFSLEVAEFNSRRVTVGGAVGSPAVVPVGLTPLRLGEALAAAGGVAARDQDFASVRVFRDGALYEIPLSDLTSRADLQRIRLQDGDSVFVDTAYDVESAATYFEQQIALADMRQRARVMALDGLATEVALRRAQLAEARGNFEARAALDAVDRDYVYLAGEVGQQSRYPLPFGRKAHLADALFDGGNGIAAATGDLSQLYVLRASDDPREFGAVTAYHLDARNAALLTLAARFELRPGDIVFVAEQPVTRWGRTIRQITPSLVTTAVASAGN